LKLYRLLKKEVGEKVHTIHSASKLVEEQQRWVTDQCPSEGYPLLLASGQLRLWAGANLRMYAIWQTFDKIAVSLLRRQLAPGKSLIVGQGLT
jgi:hypothetical protein